jgi:hypothetical protein
MPLLRYFLEISIKGKIGEGSKEFTGLLDTPPLKTQTRMENKKKDLREKVDCESEKKRTRTGP